MPGLAPRLWKSDPAVPHWPPPRRPASTRWRGSREWTSPPTASKKDARAAAAAGSFEAGLMAGAVCGLVGCRACRRLGFGDRLPHPESRRILVPVHKFLHVGPIRQRSEAPPVGICGRVEYIPVAARVPRGVLPMLSVTSPALVGDHRAGVSMPPHPALVPQAVASS